MKWKEHSIKNTPIKFGGICIPYVENMVLAISYFIPSKLLHIVGH